MISVITAQGVGEYVGQSAPRMCERVMRFMPSGEFVEIPADDYVTVGTVGVDEDQALSKSRTEVKRAVLQAVADTPNPAVLLGYSGGALAVGDAAAEIAAGQHPDLYVRAVGLVSDPAQPRGQATQRWGITGSRTVGDSLPTMWAYDTRDPICCTPEYSPLRTLADQLSGYSVEHLDSWAADLLDRLFTGRWQPSAVDWLHPLRTWRRYQQALIQARFYLEGGHYSAYLGGDVAELGRWLTGAALR